MKKFLLATTALAAMTMTAAAADLPARAPAVAPAPVYAAPIFTWTGFYVGAQIGGAWTNDKTTEFNTATGVADGFGGSNNASGVVGGGFAGYNWQFNAFVLGLEGDIEGTSLSKSSICQVNFTTGACFGGTYAYSAKIDFQGSIRGRLGYSFGNALMYVTGGWAFANYKTDYSTTIGAVTTVASFSDTRSGWTLGGGLEYAFSPNWTARVEYRYSDFGHIADVVPAGGPATFAGLTERHKLTEQAVRVGIAYKFGGAAVTSPVLAKY